MSSSNLGVLPNTIDTNGRFTKLKLQALESPRFAHSSSKMWSASHSDTRRACPFLKINTTSITRRNSFIRSSPFLAVTVAKKFSVPKTCALVQARLDSSGVNPLTNVTRHALYLHDAVEVFD